MIQYTIQVPSTPEYRSTFYMLLVLKHRKCTCTRAFRTRNTYDRGVDILGVEYSVLYFSVHSSRTLLQSFVMIYVFTVYV